MIGFLILILRLEPNETCENAITLMLGNCEVCSANESKYTCPRCEVKTCSLICVKIHKNELNCNGIRDKTLYKPLNKFNNLDLLSDYRLLEEISRSVNKYHKDINKRWTRFQTSLPIQLFKLRGAAYSRGIRLLFLPQNFARHKENTTYYDWKTKHLFWRIEWIFFSLSEKIKFVDDRVIDTEKLGTTFSKYLSQENHKPELELYYSADYSGISLLLKAEKTAERWYHELDMHLSLRENLKKKTIIEYPVIYVILKHQKDEYELINSDDEKECENKINENEEESSQNKVIDLT
ncbi:hypothetical protein PGB90_007215 [Kerria lacca]